MTRSSSAKNARIGRVATRKPSSPSKPVKLSLSLDLMAKSTEKLVALDLDRLYNFFQFKSLTINSLMALKMK